MDEIAALPPRDLITWQNRSVVQHASSFVGARTGQGAKFMEKNFGTRRRHSIAGVIRQKYSAALNDARRPLDDD